MSRRKKNILIQRIEFFAFAAAVKIIRLLPLGIAFRLSEVVSKAAYFLVPGIKRRVIQHLIHAGVAGDVREAGKIAFRNFIHFGKVAIEIAKVDQIVTPENYRKYSIWELTPEADKTLRGEKGIVMVGCHFGNWEMSGLLYSLEYKPIVSIMRPLDNMKINEFIESRRKNFNQEICYKSEAVRVAIRVLKAGKTLGILSDQHAGTMAGGIETTFFGHPARTYPTAAYLSLRLGCPLFLGYAKRLKDDFIHEYNVIGPITVERTGNLDKDAQMLTQAFTSVLEAEIRKTPEQWLWAHRRWLDINRNRKKKPS